MTCRRPIVGQLPQCFRSGEPSNPTSSVCQCGLAPALHDTRSLPPSSRLPSPVSSALCRDEDGSPSRAIPPHLGTLLWLLRERVLGEGEEFFLGVYFCSLFSQTQHRINRGDSWRTLKFVCGRGAPPTAAVSVLHLGGLGGVSTP